MHSQNAYFHRKCPCCGSGESNVEVKSTPPAEDISLNDLVPIWNGFFKKKAIFSYNRCSNCKLLYAPMFFTQSQLESLYAQMPANMDVVADDLLAKTQLGYFYTLQKYSKLTGDYLEVGPDVGLFTQYLVDQGNYNKHWMFEPNLSVKQNLKSLMKDRLCHISHNMFSFEEVPNNSISTVVIIHVLDHLLNPLEMLLQLKGKMTEDSEILIVTHDEGSLLRKFTGRKWPAFCLQHPQLYNASSIEQVLKSAGFEVISISKTKNFFPLSFLIKQALWLIGIKLESLPAFTNFPVGLKLGNIITIARPRN
jgi:hypothetical protein